MVEKATVFDIDGTLVDVSKRYELCQKEAGNSKKAFWQCFLSEKYLHLDTPIEKTIKLVQKYFYEGVKVFIVTGRPKSLEKYTLIQLSTFNIFWNEIYFRGEKNFNKDYKYKSEVIQQLKEKYDILFIIDDSEEIRKVVQEKFGIKAIDPALIS